MKLLVQIAADLGLLDRNVKVSIGKGVFRGEFLHVGIQVVIRIC